MAMTARVSLIIATYNRGERIGETLESIRQQTQPPTEVIVVDDCSPDQTGTWVEQHYPSVRVLRPPRNGGTSAARNFGAQHAQGDRLLFLDHDDLLLPEAVDTLSALLDEFPEAQAAYADHSYENTVDQVRFPNHHEMLPGFHRLRTVPVLRSTSRGRLYGRELYGALLWGNLLQQPWMIRRETFQALGGFAAAIRFCEDWELYLRLTDRYPIVLSDEVISQHRVEGANLSLDPRQDAMHMTVLRQAIQRERFRRPLTTWKLWRKLGGYYKSRADQAASTAPMDSWRANLNALWCWPFDHVVAARALVLGPVQLVRNWMSRPSPGATIGSDSESTPKPMTE